LDRMKPQKRNVEGQVYLTTIDDPLKKRVGVSEIRILEINTAEVGALPPHRPNGILVGWRSGTKAKMTLRRPKPYYKGRHLE